MAFASSLTAPPILTLLGPTASGKTTLALAVAEKLRQRGRQAVIINGDSQQVYAELRILTARSTAEEEARAPHRLFGFLPARAACSAGMWLEHAVPTIGEVLAAGDVPLLVGGTGLYLKCLMEGLPPIPDIPPALREAIDAQWKQRGVDALYEELCSKDPETAAFVDKHNPRRITRALEVLEHTGKGLAAWQAEAPPPPFAAEQFRLFTLTPEREWLYGRINARVPLMVEQGALEEVRALMQQDLPGDLPAMRSLGLDYFAAHLRGECPLEQAIADTQQATRRYAKRQLTWNRNQLTDAASLDPSATASEKLCDAIVDKIDPSS